MTDFKVRATVRTDTSEKYVTETVENVDDESIAVAVLRRRHPRMIELHAVQRITPERKRERR
jgi:hypothetical protein